MSFQTFISTACLVAQTGVQEVDMPPEFARFVDEPGCMSTNYKTQCILVAGGVRICYLCKFRPVVEPLYEMMTTIGSSPSTTIVFNFGLHFSRGETNLLADLLDHFLRRWEGFRAECNGQCARLIWRETTPRHFKHAGGE